jgi:hypothetical protein
VNIHILYEYKHKMKKASNITSNNRYRRSIIDDNLSQFKKRVGNINYINKPIDKDQPLLLEIDLFVLD